MPSRDLADVAILLLSENWPETMLDRNRLGVDLGCSPATLLNIVQGKTKNPNTRLSQRIYEHYSGKALLSA